MYHFTKIFNKNIKKIDKKNMWNQNNNFILEFFIENKNYFMLWISKYILEKCIGVIRKYSEWFKDDDLR